MKSPHISICPSTCSRPPSRGAWIEIMYRLPIKAHLASPPSRGAWLEMFDFCFWYKGKWSPPSRGAWIEIIVDQVSVADLSVAPLAGGVD